MHTASVRIRSGNAYESTSNQIQIIRPKEVPGASLRARRYIQAHDVTEWTHGWSRKHKNNLKSNFNQLEFN